MLAEYTQSVQDLVANVKAQCGKGNSSDVNAVAQVGFDSDQVAKDYRAICVNTFQELESLAVPAEVAEQLANRRMQRSIRSLT